MNAVEVSIAGRNYTIGCDDGQEEDLHMLAEYVDDRLLSIKRGYGVVNDSMAQVMLLLTMADELQEAKKDAARLRQQLTSIAESFESGKATDMERLLASTLSRVTERIERMVQ